MARDRAARDSRYLYEDNSDKQRERDREERRYRRRHRHRDDFDYDYEDHRQRRERRRAEEARRQAEVDIDELRARRESYYSRPEADRRRDSQRMAQDIRVEREKDRPRSSKKEVRRDGTVRRKKRRETVEDDRSDDYVYGRPKSRAVVEEVTICLAAQRRSAEIEQEHVGTRVTASVHDQTVRTTYQHYQIAGGDRCASSEVAYCIRQRHQKK
ncbi:uncharacterized protein N0V89_008775 [Didymosphaeria variabile]|uniref:Uncharacterized protein n=1 Tax=Didymosphaeria variabile TaxID=1932322 RepID=A0A9W8XGC9_9PLEO|nr:uncharacterized protein N0V89_008775 [Didymosphaeria variabile]KAJ4350154.1 hypothetical protein N0V89_008775 [Didymosphaeria variabile]